MSMKNLAGIISSPSSLLREQALGFIKKGQEALEANDAATAVKLFKPATQAAPEILEAWLGLGDAQSDLGNSLEAIEAYKKAVALQPEDPEVFLQLGREQLTAELHSEAELNLMHGLVLSQDAGAVADDYYNLALCLYLQGREAEAIPFCRRAQQYESEADVEMLLGNSLYDIGGYEEAVTEYQKVLRHDPENDSCLVNLGLALEFLGNQEEAIPILQKAAAKQPENAELYASLSRCFEAAGNDDEAQKAALKYHELTDKPEVPSEETSEQT
jgi:tetratricopeptide (TPR) repeat protein